MGFSIGSLLAAAAPIVGGFLGGPTGALIGGAISSAFTRPSAPSLPGPTVQQAMARSPGRAIVTGLFGETVMTIADLLKLSRERTGKPASSRAIREAARVCGIELAAQTFQLTETEICRIVVQTGRRRARGISAADLRRTRSTLRKVHNIQHDLRALAPPATRRRIAHHHHK